MMSDPIERSHALIAQAKANDVLRHKSDRLTKISAQLRQQSSAVAASLYAIRADAEDLLNRLSEEGEAHGL